MYFNIDDNIFRRKIVKSGYGFNIDYEKQSELTD